MDSSVNTSLAEGRVRGHVPGHGNVISPTPLVSTQRRTHAATVIKSLGLGLSVNTSIPPCLGEHGFPPASQIPVFNFGCSVTVVSKYDCQPILGNFGDRHSCRKTNRGQGIQVACYGDCSTCSSPSSASPEESLCSVPHPSYLTHS